MKPCHSHPLVSPYLRILAILLLVRRTNNISGPHLTRQSQKVEIIRRGRFLEYISHLQKPLCIVSLVHLKFCPHVQFVGFNINYLPFQKKKNNGTIEHHYFLDNATQLFKSNANRPTLPSRIGFQGNLSFPSHRKRLKWKRF